MSTDRCMGQPAKRNRPRRFDLAAPQRRGSSIGPMTLFNPRGFVGATRKERRANARAEQRAFIEAKRADRAS